MTATSNIVNLPPLENGDRLTQYEFERRYQAMIQIKKAELIEGVVYVASPVRMANHGRPNFTVELANLNQINNFFSIFY